MKNYNLVDDEFARMCESGHDPQLLAENGSFVGEFGREKDGYDGTAAPATSNVVLAFVFCGTRTTAYLLKIIILTLSEETAIWFSVKFIAAFRV